MATKYLSQAGVSTLWNKVKAIVNAKYTKPSTGIPKSDLETTVQNTLNNAVAGPASSVDAHIAVFSGTSGKVVKDSGFTIGTSVPSGAVFTDFCVTDEIYHYKPTGGSTTGLDADTIDTPGGVVQAIKVDSSGHVTGIVIKDVRDYQYKTRQAAVSSPSASGNSISFIDTLSQDANGQVTATKKTVPAASASQDGLMITTDKSKLDGIAQGAQVNVIEKISVNGTALTPTSKSVNITVPTNNNALTNGAGYQTKSDVEAIVNQKLTTAVIPKGNLSAINLPIASQSNLGWMYNITTPFKVNSGILSVGGKTYPNIIFLYDEHTSDFDGDYPAGTNVYVVSTANGGYAWDIMNGFVNLDDYIQALTDTEINAICV